MRLCSWNPNELAFFCVDVLQLNIHRLLKWDSPKLSGSYEDLSLMRCESRRCKIECVLLNSNVAAPTLKHVHLIDSEFVGQIDG